MVPPRLVGHIRYITYSTLRGINASIRQSTYRKVISLAAHMLYYYVANSPGINISSFQYLSIPPRFRRCPVFLLYNYSLSVPRPLLSLVYYLHRISPFLFFCSFRARLRPLICPVPLLTQSTGCYSQLPPTITARRRRQASLWYVPARMQVHAICSVTTSLAPLDVDLPRSKSSPPVRRVRRCLVYPFGSRPQSYLHTMTSQ
ncbi:hypothetical protein L226DRAFT_59112 [Lentinus tigrinus ALCF2SS1-7]|uniref:Uncharacterized protein n=1 Tax=Lentinus tigrinus ALCF2SS1-6 TaxID=1328759 RepID=A0A5C2SD21_9APHY|nr:hypothetical protein L227DRAFT_78799 [Lentinus tigrinus ALCF2SS1-6]RPD75261.1 hypothetical protein L226DRAFT_59112 [Lentinus tigrinus ALCF2SS1-7]